MNDDQFTQLVKYIEDFFSEVNSKLDDTASQSSLDSLTNTIDHFVGRLDAEEVEQAARDAQFAYLRWMGQKSVKKDWCATAGFLSLDAAHIHIQFPHKIFRYFGLSLILALLRLFGWKDPSSGAASEAESL